MDFLFFFFFFSYKLEGTNFKSLLSLVFFLQGTRLKEKHWVVVVMCTFTMILNFFFLVFVCVWDKIVKRKFVLKHPLQFLLATQMLFLFFCEFAEFKENFWICFCILMFLIKRFSFGVFCLQRYCAYTCPFFQDSRKWVREVEFESKSVVKILTFQIRPFRMFLFFPKQNLKKFMRRWKNKK